LRESLSCVASGLSLLKKFNFCLFPSSMWPLGAAPRMGGTLDAMYSGQQGALTHWTQGFSHSPGVREGSGAPEKPWLCWGVQALPPAQSPARHFRLSQR
jgi:hypothetical protein